MRRNRPSSITSNFSESRSGSDSMNCCVWGSFVSQFEVWSWNLAIKYSNERNQIAFYFFCRWKLTVLEMHQLQHALIQCWFDSWKIIGCQLQPRGHELLLSHLCKHAKWNVIKCVFLSPQRATRESSVAQTASEHKGLTPAALRVSAVSVSGWRAGLRSAGASQSKLPRLHQILTFPRRRSAELTVTVKKRREPCGTSGRPQSRGLLQRLMGVCRDGHEKRGLLILCLCVI